IGEEQIPEDCHSPCLSANGVVDPEDTLVAREAIGGEKINKIKHTQRGNETNTQNGDILRLPEQQWLMCLSEDILVEEGWLSDAQFEWLGGVLEMTKHNCKLVVMETALFVFKKRNTCKKLTSYSDGDNRSALYTVVIISLSASHRVSIDVKTIISKDERQVRDIRTDSMKS
ncbi:hypothetical protein C0J52_19725, partial [Blattella germanica]